MKVSRDLRECWVLKVVFIDIQMCSLWLLNIVYMCLCVFLNMEVACDLRECWVLKVSSVYPHKCSLWHLHIVYIYLFLLNKKITLYVKFVLYRLYVFLFSEALPHGNRLRL